MMIKLRFHTREKSSRSQLQNNKGEISNLFMTVQTKKWSFSYQRFSIENDPGSVGPPIAFASHADLNRNLPLPQYPNASCLQSMTWRYLDQNNRGAVIDRILASFWSFFDVVWYWFDWMTTLQEIWIDSPPRPQRCHPWRILCSITRIKCWPHTKTTPSRW